MKSKKSLSHPARVTHYLARFAAMLVASLAIAGCATTGGGFSGAPGEARAERLAQNGDHQDAAAVYTDLAASAAGSDRDRLTLLAVEQWLDAGDATRARNAFVSVNRPADTQSGNLWKTNSATLMLYQGEADQALEILEPMSREAMARNRRLRVDALRADAWIQKEDPARAIELMTQRETLLTSRRSIENNRQHL